LSFSRSSSSTSLLFSFFGEDVVSSESLLFLFFVSVTFLGEMFSFSDGRFKIGFCLLATSADLGLPKVEADFSFLSLGVNEVSLRDLIRGRDVAARVNLDDA
jgi:hypothetical protein